MSSARGESYVRGGFGPEPVSLGRVSGCGLYEVDVPKAYQPKGSTSKSVLTPPQFLVG